MKYQSNHVKSWHQYENVRSTPRRPFFQGRPSVESKHPWSRDFWGEQNPWISWISPLERGAGVGLSQALRVLPEAFSAQGIKYVGSCGKAQNLGKYVDTHMGKLWIYDIMIYIYIHIWDIGRSCALSDCYFFQNGWKVDFERAMVILYGGLLCVSHYMNVICGRISLDDAYRRISTVLSRLIGCRIKMW